MADLDKLEAAERALKALAAWDRYEPNISTDQVVRQAEEMAEAIRGLNLQALARRDGVEEPVAWRIQWEEGDDWDYGDQGDDPITQEDFERLSKKVAAIEWLYAHPAPTAPGDWSVLSDLHTIKGWLHGLSTVGDLEEVAADGGVTVGMIYQQEARGMAGRLGRVLAALRQPDTAGE